MLAKAVEMLSTLPVLSAKTEQFYCLVDYFILMTNLQQHETVGLFVKIAQMKTRVALQLYRVLVYSSRI